jgi:hypothetical protein
MAATRNNMRYDLSDRLSISLDRSIPAVTMRPYCPMIGFRLDGERRGIFFSILPDAQCRSVRPPLGHLVDAPGPAYNLRTGPRGLFY